MLGSLKIFCTPYYVPLYSRKGFKYIHFAQMNVILCLLYNKMSISPAHREMIMISYFLVSVLRLSAPLTIFVLVASAWFATVDARATVQSKRSSMQQQQLQRMQEFAPEEDDTEQEPLISQELRNKIVGEPWLRAQVRQEFSLRIF